MFSLKKRQFVKLLKQVHSVGIGSSYRLPIIKKHLNRPQKKALMTLVNKIKSDMLRYGTSQSEIDRFDLDDFCWNDVLYGELKNVGYPYSLDYKIKKDYHFDNLRL